MMYRVLSGPTLADEPLTLEVLRSQVNIAPLTPGGTHPDDNMLLRFGRAARASAEAYCDRAFSAQTWLVAFSTWNEMLTETLPGGFVAELGEIKYRDTLGAEVVLPADQVYLDQFARPARIREAFDADPFPALHPKFENRITAEITVGAYGMDNPLQEDVLAAMLLIAADLYVHREDRAPGVLQTLPLRAASLLATHRAGLGV